MGSQKIEGEHFGEEIQMIVLPTILEPTENSAYEHALKYLDIKMP